MVTTGLTVRLEAKAGKEHELARFLLDALPLVEDEPETVAWFAIRAGESPFAIVDFFPDEAGRRAHLEGPVADALGERADELLSEAPILEHVDVLAAKLPGRAAHDERRDGHPPSPRGRPPHQRWHRGHPLLARRRQHHEHRGLATGVRGATRVRRLERGRTRGLPPPVRPPPDDVRQTLSDAGIRGPSVRPAGVAHNRATAPVVAAEPIPVSGLFETPDSGRPRPLGRLLSGRRWPAVGFEIPDRGAAFLWIGQPARQCSGSGRTDPLR